MDCKIIIFLCFVSLCGVLGKKERIFGGTVATISQFPFMASIRKENNDFICGATIVSRMNVLTIAECIFPHQIQINSLKVITGTVSSTHSFGTHRIETVHYHPMFTIHLPLIYSIVVVKLRHAIFLNGYQNIIPLTNSPIQSMNQALLSGWGLYDRYEGALLAVRLRKASVFTLTHTDCQGVVNFPLLEMQFCTYQNHGIGACYGDAGGPVVVNGELHGIITHTTRRGDETIPDIHTSVYEMLDFIRAHLHE